MCVMNIRPAHIVAQRPSPVRLLGAARPAPLDPPRPHGPVGALRWADRGRLRVRRARGGRESTVFDPFSPECAYLGEVASNVEGGPRDVARGMLAGVMEDAAFGIQTVARWRVVA